MDRNRASELSVVVGIDFGTTFSGVAWTWSGDLDNVRVIDTWGPATNGSNYNFNSNKVPTAIQYNPDGTQAWGFNLDDPLTWFKLILNWEHLPEEIKESKPVARVVRLLNKLGKSARDVTADYLRHLWTHAVTCIENELGPNFIRGICCKVVLTMPAIWSQKAESRMRQAAARAGITRGIIYRAHPYGSDIPLDDRVFGRVYFDLVQEPEAAARAQLSSPEFTRRPDLIKPGDVFIVCDAGGGTGDVISYRITSLNPLKLAECIEGRGGLCGAIFIDEAFEKQLEAVLGSRWTRLSQLQKKKFLNDEWEHGIKRRFDGTQTSFPLYIPQSLARRSIISFNWGPEPDFIELPGEIVENLFTPACNEIRNLINHQIRSIYRMTRRYPKDIILVGGLGSSNYLGYLLRNEHLGRIGIRQGTGNKPWTAVARGAVASCISNDIVRVARRSYGICFEEDYDRRKHMPHEKTWNYRECRWTAVNQMMWYIRRGDSVDEKKPVRLTSYWLYQGPEEMPNESFSIEIWESASPQPPRRITDEVRRLCEIVCPVDIPFEQLPVYKNMNGVTYRKLEYEVAIVPKGASLEFRVFINGTEQGRESIKVRIE